MSNRTYTPPGSVKEIVQNGLLMAKQAIELDDLKLAQALAKQENLSLDEVKQLAEGEASDLTGGDVAKAWAQGIVKAGGCPERAPLKAECKFVKSDEKLGLVFGYALICKENGEDYYDLGSVDKETGIRWRDNITEEAMLKAATKYMQSDRELGDMHKGPEGGTIVFAFPLTTEVAKAYEIETPRTGLMIAAKPQQGETLEDFEKKFKEGFSIGGFYGDIEEIE